MKTTRIGAPRQTEPASGYANEWVTRAETFLLTLGESYVIRFRDSSDLMRVTGISTGELDRDQTWQGIRRRAIRLKEFVGEFSG